MAIGSYAVERDYSHYVAYAAKTILAVVGTASKGPIGVATVCTSAQDLVNKFGPLKSGYYGLYAGQYFLSQSSKLYFVRAASDSAAEATTAVAGETSQAASLADAITFNCIETGTYGNGYTITVTAGTPKEIDGDTVDTYNITVKSAYGGVLEIIKNIALEELNIGYTTNYIKVSAMNPLAMTLSVGTSQSPAVYTLAGGDDGVSDISAAEYIIAAGALEADTVDMNLVAVPGNSDDAVIASMLALAENRGDCLYLVDPPSGLTRDGVIAWHNGTGAYDTHSVYNSSYGALYYDWVAIYDPVNKVKIQVPPSVVVSASIAYSDRIADLWYAPAGLTRGLVRGVLDSVTKLSKNDIDLLYTGDNSINAIYDDPQVGLVLWGQKTLYREDSALNRVNVRRLLNYLKRIITAACDYLTFEPNDRRTWNSFEMKVSPVLENIQNRRGIYEYRIISGESIVSDGDIDNYRMPCMIMIRPTKAAEEIPIYFTITSTGADFNETLEFNGIINS